MPRYSIITVTKDNLVGLKKTHTSVQSQTYTDYEWIVIDGGSKDGTRTFLKTTQADWISEPDEGLYDAMNKGIDKAKGEYIIFMNAGDQFADSKVLNELSQYDADFIYGDALEGESRHYKKAKSHTNMACGMFTHHQAMVYNRRALGATRYDLQYTVAADYDLTVRVLKNLRNVVYAPNPLCIFETGGLSQQQALQGRKEQFNVRQNLNIVPPWQNHLIYWGQACAWTLRRFAPVLYWHLRSWRNIVRAYMRDENLYDRPENRL